ncbi:uncharacterized protein TRIADDRAFT_58457 [Trichoplax adhaerens]|uniref:Uncharacterized protein n=1 Tax=Trichoplax adhaerens TaxID=10228 RepID=B3S2R7_TRIAD|nr:hypothetical protein TRIADDRAFT_58457 [Trichoplax adhaerens]EDV22836.1 hypothetical protein TRIADDRAFT_58457 [Trichoplax adhaerens]|eukprot:XP_002114702.1 hypothetical protein TRIADDRAFT_58457 [Trichoplax adhaerens]
MDNFEKQAIEDYKERICQSVPIEFIQNALSGMNISDNHDLYALNNTAISTDKNETKLNEILQAQDKNTFKRVVAILREINQLNIQKLANELEEHCQSLRTGKLEDAGIQQKKKFSAFGFLGEESHKIPVIGQVPVLPDNIVAREKISKKLSGLLQIALKNRKCVVVHGEAGCGKTTAAYLTLFVNDLSLANKLHKGGVIWIKLSNSNSAEILLQMQHLLTSISNDESRLPSTIEECKNQISCIIDDVLDKNFIKCFDFHCATLVTSRQPDIADNTYESPNLFEVEPFQLNELKEIILYDLESVSEKENCITTKMARILEYYHNLPICLNSLRILNLTNSQEVNRHLLALGSKIDRAMGHNKTLQTTLDFIIRSLDETKRSHYQLLVVFANSDKVPITAVSLLWSLDIKVIKKMFENLVHGGLMIKIIDTISGNRYYRLHSVFCHYLLEKYPHAVGFHRKLISHYKENCRDALYQLADDGYIYNHIIVHLLAAREVKTIKMLLTDPKWLQSKLNMTSITHVLNDYIKCRQILNDQEWQEVSHFYRFLSANMNILLRTDRPTLAQLSLSKTEWQVFSKKARDLINKNDTSTIYVEWMNKEAITNSDDSITTAYLHEGAVSDCRYSCDGRRIVTSSWDGIIKVWDPISTAVFVQFHGVHKISCCCFSPNRRYVVTASWTGTAQVWDIEMERLHLEYSNHSDRIYWCDFSPDGQYIASCSKDKTIRIWKIPVAKVILDCVCHRQDSNYRITSCAFFNDDQAILCTYRQFVHTWSCATGEPLFQLKCFGPITASALSCNSKYLAVSVRGSNAVQVWNLSNQKQVAFYRGHTDYTQAVHFAPNGKTIISASDDKTVKFWSCQIDLKNTVHVRSKRMQFKPTPFECRFVDNIMHAYCITESNGYQLKHFIGSDSKLASKCEKFSELIWKCCLSQDGYNIAVGLYNGEIKLLSASNQQVIWSEKPSNESVVSFLFTDRGNKLLVVYETEIYILSRRNGYLLGKISKLCSVIKRCLPVNDKLHKVILAFKNGKLQMIQFTNNQVLLEKKAHKNGIEICEISPIRSFIITSAANGVAKRHEEAYELLCLLTWFSREARI